MPRSSSNYGLDYNDSFVSGQQLYYGGGSNLGGTGVNPAMGDRFDRQLPVASRPLRHSTGPGMDPSSEAIRKVRSLFFEAEAGLSTASGESSWRMR
jgi:hypothetical protein